ncbi:hypothetical protein N9O88_01075 [bacterium]|nr:hypothetical protein [bacterium]
MGLLSDSDVVATVNPLATVLVSIEKLSSGSFNYDSLTLELSSDSNSQEIFSEDAKALTAEYESQIIANDTYKLFKATYKKAGSSDVVKNYPYTGSSLVINQDPQVTEALSIAITVNVNNPLSKCDPQTHEFPIAYIGGEVTKLESADVIEISFQKWCVEWCDFLKIFYNCSNDFKVGQHLKCDFQKIIAFNQQREYCFKDSIDGSASILPYCLPFNLKDKVIDTWTQELKEKDNCKSIDRCSLMKLTKELNQLRTIADMYKLCKLKVESISRIELVEQIINSYANKNDEYCFNISVQINPNSGGLTPILLNFKYVVSFANQKEYFIKDPNTGERVLNYNFVLCPIKCECCKPKFLCKEDCSCLPSE